MDREIFLKRQMCILSLQVLQDEREPNQKLINNLKIIERLTLYLLAIQVIMLE